MNEGPKISERIPEIKISQAVPEDASGIRDVQRDAWIATYPNEEYGIMREDVEAKNWGDERVERWKKRIEELGNERRIWSAKERNKVVGFCVAAKGIDSGQIEALYISPEYQGRHVGSNLMKEAVAWLNPEHDAIVEVAKYNEKAISFYKAFGFEGEEDITDPAFVAHLASGKVIPEVRMTRKASKEVGKVSQ